MSKKLRRPTRPVQALSIGIVGVGCLAVAALLLPRAGQIGAEPPASTRPSGQEASTTQPAASRPDRAGLQTPLDWPRPRTTDRQAERERMVDQQIARDSMFRDSVGDSKVLAAMRAVPRHLFVPDWRASEAYADTPLPIGYGQTISQPYIVALMTEQLALKPGDKVLEIGTGSGYQAAVLNELTPHVFSIEIIKALYEAVNERFEKHGYTTIRTKCADGYDGWPEQAPFDAIIVTCAAGHVPPPLWEQLKPGGRMVIPIGGVHEVQRLVVLTKQANGRQKSKSILPVRFVPMVGKALDDD